MIGVGVVGYGYWGPQLARNFATVAGARLVAICDGDTERLARAHVEHPQARCVTTLSALLAEPDLHAVAIATPVSSHFALAQSCLAAGKHVLLEKPMAASSAQAQALVALASDNRCLLLVDHTYLYSSAVQTIAATMARGELGDVYSYESVRINLGRFRADVDVLWDLASHDLAIIDHLFADAPTSLQAVGFTRVPGEPCELAYLTLRWSERRIAQIHVSWLAPVKIRRTLIGGSRGMVVYDDLDPDSKVRIYDSEGTRDRSAGVALQESTQRRIGFRKGEMRAPRLTVAEPLHTLVAHFIDCVAGACRPRSDGASGVRVVRWLEAACRSLAHSGLPVDLGAASEPGVR